jgi:transcriptional regulator with XRE-family HTH domain
MPDEKLKMPPSSILPPIRLIFAKRLKALRIPRGYPTARSFAVALEIDENRYTRYERAEVEPDLSLLAKICTLLGVSPNDLLDVATAPSTAAHGFAENAHAPPLSANSDGANGLSRRRALAWQLAEEITKFDLTPAAHSLDKVLRISKLFGEILADPFSFVARFTAEGRFDTVDNQTAGRLGQIMEDLIDATKTEVLGQRRQQERPVAKTE